MMPLAVLTKARVPCKPLSTLLIPFLYFHRDEYTVSQLPGGEGARFAVSGVVCSREDMTLVPSQPLLYCCVVPHLPHSFSSVQECIKFAHAAFYPALLLLYTDSF